MRRPSLSSSPAQPNLPWRSFNHPCPSRIASSSFDSPPHFPAFIRWAIRLKTATEPMNSTAL